MVYCKICHKELHEKAEICPDCGVRNTRSIERIPELSVILSLIIPGLGQSYNGQKLKAITFVYTGLFIFLTTIVYRTEFLSMVNRSQILSILDNVEFISINRNSMISAISNHIELVYPIFILLNIYDAYRVAQNINSEI